MEKSDIQDKYQSVKKSIESALENAKSINLTGDEESAELKGIIDILSSMNDDFAKEIEKLEQSAEWDKFCISFFGETNAGKSTIIESLRIIYDEESRRQKLHDQQVKYMEDLQKHEDDYKELISCLEELNSDIAISSTKKTFATKIRTVLTYVFTAVLCTCLGAALALMFVQ